MSKSDFSEFCDLLSPFNEFSYFFGLEDLRLPVPKNYHYKLLVKKRIKFHKMVNRILLIDPYPATLIYLKFQPHQLAENYSYLFN